MRRGEGGQVSVFVLGAALICFAIAGVAVDGTRAFMYRRTLQNAADAAALAGATEINVAAFYSGGTNVRVHETNARSAALEWLGRRGLAVQADVRAGGSVVRVALRGRLGTTFLSLVGVDALPVAAVATAEPIAGSP